MVSYVWVPNSDAAGGGRQTSALQAQNPNPHAPQTWTLASVLQTQVVDGKRVYVVQTEAGAKRKFFADDVEVYSAEEVRHVKTRSDLAGVHPATMLHVLQKRLEAGYSYTNLGPRTLLFLNPFTEVVPDDMLNTLLFQAVLNDNPEQSQPSAMLFQGVAGSGKTGNFSLTVAGLSGHYPDARGGMLMREAGRVLNMFGNTSTVRNKDSNRFCRALAVDAIVSEVGQTRQYQVANCRNDVFAFQASCLTKQNPGETTFHFLHALFGYLKCVHVFHEKDQRLAAVKMNNKAARSGPPSPGDDVEVDGDDSFIQGEPPANKGLLQVPPTGSAPSASLVDRISDIKADPDRALCIDASLEAKIVNEGDGYISEEDLRACMARCDLDLGPLDLDALYVLDEDHYRYMNADLQQPVQSSPMQLPEVNQTLTADDFLRCAQFLDIRRLAHQFGIDTDALDSILQCINIILKIGNVDIIEQEGEKAEDAAEQEQDVADEQERKEIAADEEAGGNADKNYELHFGGTAYLSGKGQQAIEDLTVLLGLNRQPELLQELFLVEKKQHRGADMYEPRRAASAARLRDGIASMLYESVFAHVCARVNGAVTEYMTENQDVLVVNPKDATANQKKSLYLVDCFGFESLQENSLDQFLRNYGAEVLRREFEISEVERNFGAMEQDLLTSEAVAYGSNAKLIAYYEEQFLPLVNTITLRNMVRLSDLPGDCDHLDKLITQPRPKRSQGSRPGANLSEVGSVATIVKAVNASDQMLLRRLDDMHSVPYADFVGTYHYHSTLVSHDYAHPDEHDEKHQLVRASRTDRLKLSTFLIRHHAGAAAVSYSAHEFVSKNCPVPSSVTARMKAIISSGGLNAACANVFDHFLHHAPVDHSYEVEQKPKVGLGVVHDRDPQRVDKAEPRTLAFSQELTSLLRRLDSAQMYFVLCVKPNPARAALTFDVDMVSKQLNGLGVFGLQKVLRSGYDVQMKHGEFLKQYGALFSTKNGHKGSSVVLAKKFASFEELQKLEKEDRAVCNAILQTHYHPLEKTDDFLVGKQCVFLRSSGKQGYANLNASNAYVASVVKLQAFLRGAKFRLAVRRQLATGGYHGAKKVTAQQRGEWLGKYKAKKKELLKSHVKDSQGALSVLKAVFAEHEKTAPSSAWQRCCERVSALFEQSYPDNHRAFFSAEHLEKTYAEMEALAAKIHEIAFDSHVQAAVTTHTLDQDLYNGIAHTLAAYVDPAELSAQLEQQLKLVGEHVKKLGTNAELTEGEITRSGPLLADHKGGSSEDETKNQFYSGYDLVADLYAEAQHNYADLAHHASDYSDLEREALCLRAQLLVNALFLTDLAENGMSHLRMWYVRTTSRQVAEHVGENAKHFDEYEQIILSDVKRLGESPAAEAGGAPKAVKEILTEEADEYLQRTKRNLERFLPVCTSEEVLEFTELMQDKIFVEDLERLRHWQERTELVVQWKRQPRR
eukprot:CAMPEP_0178984266 /NCGR_PEP_ID=MMETSP0795-20121207/1508_1 /TAXON_ID=88552 /ORGANISM="Amoebophrya sp., Strain Ameob2" /LENGTH=1459 /DNA_ID=CAMNT_0020675107 /DNA_START=72 /DNA_END=4448 /DNA_ORIENTATION=-